MSSSAPMGRSADGVGAGEATRSVEIAAPAKVNLFLRVLHRRPDGFRELETLFQAVSLSDRVVVGIDGDAADGPIALEVDGPDLGPIEANLAVRAAAAFRTVAGPVGSIRIGLTKQIPVGAGLGGGSSDAAAVLKCLVALTGFDDIGTLRTIAAGLGSDVPFFFGRSPLALGRGRGELLTELPPLPEAPLVLALPDVRVATGAAYAALGARRTSAAASGGHEIDPNGAPRALELDGLDWLDVVRLAENDFEAVVGPWHEEIRASLDGLRSEGASMALLSGSGAASFGLFETRSRAERAAAALSDRLGWRFEVVTTNRTVPEPAGRDAGG